MTVWVFIPLVLVSFFLIFVYSIMRVGSLADDTEEKLIEIILSASPSEANFCTTDQAKVSTSKLTIAG